MKKYDMQPIVGVMDKAITKLTKVMIGKLTPDDPIPNSDQKICENCENIIDQNDLQETIDGKSGCVNCVSQCGWCGNHYLNEDMFNNPYLGYVCDACKNAEDYMKASEDELLKDALMCYFNDIDHKGIIQLIINYAIKKGYNDLANELNNDKS